MKSKIATLAAVLSLAIAPAAFATHTTGKAGAPGQVCKSFKGKGNKSSAQRAARKACIKLAVQQRKADQTPEEQPPPPPPPEENPV